MIKVVLCKEGRAPSVEVLDLVTIVDTLHEGTIKYLDDRDDLLVICPKNCTRTNSLEKRLGVKGDFFIASFVITSFISLTENQINYIESKVLNELIPR